MSSYLTAGGLNKNFNTNMQGLQGTSNLNKSITDSAYMANDPNESKKSLEVKTAEGGARPSAGLLHDRSLDSKDLTWEK